MMNKLLSLITLALALTACSSGDGDNKTYHDRDLFNLRGNVAELTVTRTSTMGKVSTTYYFDRNGRLRAIKPDSKGALDASACIARDGDDRIDTLRMPYGDTFCYYYDGNATAPAKYKHWDPGFFKPEDVEEEAITYDKDGNMLLFIPDMTETNTYTVGKFDDKGNWHTADCREYGEKRSLTYFGDDDFAEGAPGDVVEKAMACFDRQDYDKYYEYTNAKFVKSGDKEKAIEKVRAEVNRKTTSYAQMSGGIEGNFVSRVKINKDGNQANVDIMRVFGSGNVIKRELFLRNIDGKWVIINNYLPI